MGIYDFLLPFYCTHPIVVDAAIPDPTLEDLTVGTPSAKVMAKAEASKKRKASTSGAAPSIVSKRTGSAMAQSSEALPGLTFLDDGKSDDDDDACVEIPLITPIRYAAIIPTGGNQGGALLLSLLKVLAPEIIKSADSWLRGLQERCNAYQGLESKVSGFQKQVFDLNDKHSSFDAAFVKVKVKEKEQKKKIKTFSKNLDQLTAEVAHLSSALNQAMVLEDEKDTEIIRLRASPPEFASFFHGGFQSLVQKFLASDEFSTVQGELISLDDSVGFERGLSTDQTPEEFALDLKKISRFVPEQPSTEQNEEWVRVMVDIPDTEMANGAVNELELVSSGPNDVMVTLSAGEKENVSPPLSSEPVTASTDAEKIDAAPFGV
nr:hypothetical protein [Tanacetum cinerariifolium]